MSPFPKQHLTVGGSNHLLPCLLEAINYATEINITTAFIRITGMRLIQDAIFDALQRRVRVRILTGDYLGITDPESLRLLMLFQEQGAEVKVFESEGKTSFHMKAYLFTRTAHISAAEGCAFIGSSNITQSALKDGLEWNLHIDRAEDEQRFQLILAEYKRLYQDLRCKPLTHQWIESYINRRSVQQINAPIEPGADEKEIAPEPNLIQQNALSALVKTREDGYIRGLVVMATGLGKTWLAAFDSNQIRAKRILFIAHREEILDQAEATFVRIRPDATVGRYNGTTKDQDVDMLFASVQTLGRTEHLQYFVKDYFDYIVVDEFHHAAARTYQQLLAHFKPRFLLGLTATPQRTDQSDILNLCDDNLVFKRALFDGITSKLLCPFLYYGIADVVDYQEITWRNGKFDPSELVNQLATQARAKHSLKYWKKHHQSRTLAFCISKKHADFMADYFNRHNVTAVSVHSDSEVRRNDALTKLRLGEIQVIFSVDLFNEGVDLPAIDTVLMLRPTESKIIFLQQLGRGMRNSAETSKDKLIVLDFIGNHISFFRKPEALFQIGVTNKARREFVDKLKNQTLTLPEGCFVNYDLNAVDFMEKLTSTRIVNQEDTYRALRETLGHRPTIAEFYRAGGVVDTIRKEHGQWFNFVQSQNDLTADEKACITTHNSFFAELETTNLSKSFKLVLLEAMIELGGFDTPAQTTTLATKSFEILQRRRALLADLPDNFRNLDEVTTEHQAAWNRYWQKNSINAWLGGNRVQDKGYFSLIDETFTFHEKVEQSLYSAFVLLLQELLNYRYLQYEARPSKAAASGTENILPMPKMDRQDIPYFSDLRIACGHFRTSTHETQNIESISLPLSYGRLDPARHFIATATGNSMDGGKHPIHHGDYLLLELITANSAGSNNGNIVAVERHDITGDDQYLLRTVKKLSNGQYELQAQNPNYQPMIANEEMITFARFKAVVRPADLYLHQSFMREQIPGLFGLEFNTGLWQSGHICPKMNLDQFLLVTLNKQGKATAHQYVDYFIDKQRFHWQSQASTTPTGAKGKAVIHHLENNSRVHLFVRKNKLQAGKAAPFIYLGELQYLNHKAEKPINVEWSLESPLSQELLDYLN